MRRVRLETHVGDPGDLFVLLEVSRERERVVGVTLRAERERLQALQQEERAEGVEAGAQVAQYFNAQLQGECDISERLRKLEAVVAFGGRGKSGESAGSPVEFS